MFDWLRFLENHRIEYMTSGPNVARGNVAVHCPFCGHEDRSQHMSINLSGKGWRCWRKETHSGKNPARLVMGLLGCSAEHAAGLVGSDVFVPEDLLTRVQTSLNPPQPAIRTPITLPKEFRPFGGYQINRYPLRAFAEYLGRRGFTPKQISNFTKRYQMYFCTSGPYKGRVIFTVYQDGELISWTGRSIYPSETLRYKSLTTDPEKAKTEGVPLAYGSINRFLLWYDLLAKADADTIMLCEGPFDALRVNVLGRKHGIVATCIFTSFPSYEQIDLLHELLPRFKRKMILLDQGTAATAMRLTGKLAGFTTEVGYLPGTVKDPGELTEAQLLSLVT